MLRSTVHIKLDTHLGVADCFINEIKGVVVIKKDNVIGKAKCHPRDKFDSNKGIYLALLRLSGELINKEIQEFKRRC